MRKYWDNSKSAAGDAPPEPSDLRPVPASVSLGGIQIAPATVLAPMAGVTDTVFRRFIKNLGGCGLIMTEFTSADGVLRDQRVRGRYLHFYEDEHPISAQLFGSSPSVLADAARLVEDLGFDLVDLNLGCPAKKVVKCNGGSGLLRDLPRSGKIFEAVRAAVKIPFTVKFRAGWNDEEIVCVELARMAEACGLGAVALHARTREQGYSGNARWEWIAAVKQAVKIPVIGNGDIRSPEDACAIVAQTGCDAVMIGRMAPANPWIFRQIEQYVQRGDGRPRPSGGPKPRRKAIRRTHRSRPLPDDPHLLPNAAGRRNAGAEGKMKQFASWFTHGVPGGAALRKAIYEAKSGAEILRRVEEFFEAKLACHDHTEPRSDVSARERACALRSGRQIFSTVLQPQPTFPAPRVPHIPTASGRHA